MENFSKKRGRPPKIPPGLLAGLRVIYSEYTSARSLNNMHYLQIAFAVLDDDREKYRYLLDRGGGRMRTTILTALGRLEDPDDIREIGAYVCEKRIKTAEALTLIRIVRRQLEADRAEA